MKIPSEFRRRETQVKHRNGVLYTCYHYWVPSSVVKQIGFLRKYYKHITKYDESIPNKFRRRNSNWDYSDDAFEALNVIRKLLSMKTPVFIGSRYLDARAWAIFGDSKEVGFAQQGAYINLSSFEDVLTFYGLNKFKGSFRKVNIQHNEEAKDLHPLKILSSFTKLPPAFLLTVSLSLLTDIILYSGPDSDEFYHFFTNDKRHKPNEKEVVTIWKNLKDSCIIPPRKGSTEEVLGPLASCQVSSCRSLIKIPSSNKQKTKEKDWWKEGYTRISLYEELFVDNEKFGKSLEKGEKCITVKIKRHTSNNSRKINKKSASSFTLTAPSSTELIPIAFVKEKSGINTTYGNLAEKWLKSQGVAKDDLEKNFKDWYLFWWEEIGYRTFGDFSGNEILKRKFRKKQKTRVRAFESLKDEEEPKRNKISPSGITAAQVAESWCKQKNIKVPRRGTPQWEEMFKKWYNAFSKDNENYPILNKSE